MSFKAIRRVGQFGLLIAGVLFVYSFVKLGQEPPEGSTARTESMQFVTYGGIACALSFFFFLFAAILRSRGDEEEAN